MHRVKLAVHKDTAECVAVKIVTVNGKEGLTDECLRKEVGSGRPGKLDLLFRISARFL